MYANVLAVVAACGALQSLPVLPSDGVLAAVTALGGGLLTCATRVGRGPMARLMATAAVFALAFAWAGMRAEWRIGDALAADLEGQDLQVSGAIVSLPLRSPGSLAFDFELDDEVAGVPRLLRLRWYAERAQPRSLPRLVPGERWRLTVRLRRPHGRLNPHGGDSDARMLAEGVRAVGYVRAGADAELLRGHGGGIRAWVSARRLTLRQRFESALAGRTWAGVAVAIALGDQSAIAPGQWQMLRDLGIVHLAVVSGLHVAMAAACGGLAVAGVWRRSRLVLRLPAPTAGMLAGLATAWTYAALSGFGLPVQRSVLMLSIVVACWLLNRRMRPGRVLAAALLAVLAVDPWAVLAPGMWLSFIAVAILLVAGRRAAESGGWRRMPVALLQTQAAIGVAMIPVLLILFQQFSLVAPVANLLAVPMFSLIVLPLCLAYVVLPLDSLVLLAHAVVEWTMKALAWLSASGFASWQRAAPPTLMAVAAGLACGWAILPRGTPGRIAALLALVPLLTFRPERPAHGEFTVVALDVGQGLAVHVATAGHDLMFDAGPRWRGGDAGRSVILPYLRASGVERLDMLVVSHADSDHAGGARSIGDGLQVARGATIAGVDIGGEGVEWTICRDGESWVWDGVRFDWLNPLSRLAAGAADRNDRSCVLRVSAAAGRALVVADIGQSAEAQLVAADAAALRADVVLVPHHGSATSSSAAFVEAVAPAAAIYSVGHRSRFGHPRPEVWARWDAVGARGLRTDSQGAIRARFGGAGLVITSERQQRERYWHGR
ncbi:MAG: DNA internalization-related competence protein ComEC/Rec2 [Zoogloeaceae bacterium]|nr:DNA internalization-related competence protein ComEC/Rec2 [Rhodocyclaceae bacterium]MCP5234413.1 DNA internalization-related competence protein ComEC/Rec2 [Zoogloeaceae bacterium]